VDFDAYDIIIDAILGIGIQGMLRNEISAIIDDINNSKAYKVSVDIPTGLDPDTGIVVDKCVNADLIVTFHDMKKGLEKLKDKECVKGWILDGFPRTLQQAQALDRILTGIRTSIGHVLNFEIAEEKIIKRISGRRSCESCQSAYHIYFNLPKKDGVCDSCGGRLIQRNDDKEETVRERLKVYQEKTQPLVNYYSERSLLKKVEADDDIENVFTRICSLVQ
jgi:adenylate kinase family enzyme